MHPRSRHHDRYDLKKLILTCPELKTHVFTNEHGSHTIDFSKPDSVKLLNEAILKDFYQVKWWKIPDQFLCPPIPGRADYLHYMADLFSHPKGLKGLDIGVGANCIYPLIGQFEYGWSFIGSDIDDEAIKSAKTILDHNPHLKNSIEIRKQNSKSCIFKGILKPEEKINFSICNPPFHASAEEARESARKKRRNLGLKGSKLNFGGLSHELWCEGGEKAFVLNMMGESASFKTQCQWFSTLVSKKENVDIFQKKLRELKAFDVRLMEMGQGQKKSRLIAWSFQG
jgi:23S rRNA (adenine1618-N6)-methyltransferase